MRNLAKRRRGTVLPLLAVSLVGACGFVALAVDVGMVAVAKNECQNAADAAALAGVRSIDGSANPNLEGATSNARRAAQSNRILGQQAVWGNVNVTHGAFHYDTSTEIFTPQFPPVAPDTYNLTRTQVTRRSATGFARMLGMSQFDVTATAMAAHRPRDVSILLDFSGSMNNESDLWNNEGYLGSANNSPNNTDPIAPKFGQYWSGGYNNVVCTSTDPRVGKCNVTQSVLGVPALVDGFYRSNRGAATPLRAFTSEPYTGPENYATTNPGDRFMKKSGTSTTPDTPARTVQEVTGATNAQVTAKTDAAMPSYVNFQGYTKGPGYWGKTFFIWPPDPASTNDWRQKFFGTTNNTKLWDSSGNWRTPSGNYTINYAAILDWIKNSGDNPFPTQLRAGRILYYDAIPTDVPASAYDHTKANSLITDPNQRFWKEYIDFTIGVWRDPFGNIQAPGSPSCSYGPDFASGTVKITAPVTGYGSVPTTRMRPQDNPKRPRHRLWFGPMTMIQFMLDTKLLPGNATDISMYPAKLGIAGALQDIRNNHPNDLVSIGLFCRPQYSGDPAGAGAFSNVLYSLSREYDEMIDSLWFPPNSGTNDVRPWDANGLLVPRAYGDYASNTATSYGFMLAYNQLSGSTTLKTKSAGGLGRKGTQRLVILETDGMANVDSNPATSFYNAGAGKSHYRIMPGDSVSSGGYSEQNLMKVVQAICNKANGTAANVNGYSPNPGYPGFATARKPVIIHTIAFGAIFESTASGTDQTNAISLLQKISKVGGTTFPGSAGDANNGYKWCIGNMEQRKSKLRTAFSAVMDDGVSVILIE